MSSAFLFIYHCPRIYNQVLTIFSLNKTLNFKEILS